MASFKGPQCCVWTGTISFCVRKTTNSRFYFIFSLVGACGAPLGLEDGRIPKLAMSASSMWDARHGPWRARLNQLNRGGAGAWSTRYNNVAQWLHIDLGEVSKVVAVATQGRYDANQWVKKYKISYSVYGRKFTFYSIKRRVQVREDVLFQS